MARKKRAFNLFEGPKDVDTNVRVSDVDYLEELEKGAPATEKPGTTPAKPAAKNASKAPAKQTAATQPKSTPKPKAVNITKRPAKEFIRKTFVVHPDDLKILDDIVHQEKSSGNYNYTYKEAIGQAIHLLKKKKGR